MKKSIVIDLWFTNGQKRSYGYSTVDFETDDKFIGEMEEAQRSVEKILTTKEPFVFICPCRDHHFYFLEKFYFNPSSVIAAEVRMEDVE